MKREITHATPIHTPDQINRKRKYEDFMEDKLREWKWGDLNTDCLVEILAKVDTATLAKSVSLVCKSWNDATLDPRCWKTLVFTKADLQFSNFIKFAVGRSQGSAIAVEIPVKSFCVDVSSEILTYICERCPNLKLLDMSLSWNHDKFNYDDIFSKLKKLEVVKLARGNKPIINMLEPISANCKNLVGLHIYRYREFCEEDVSAIVRCTPKIKYLNLYPGRMSRRELRTILMKCRELEELYASCDSIYPDKDDEILKLSSHIKFFNVSLQRGNWGKASDLFPSEHH